MSPEKQKSLAGVITAGFLFVAFLIMSFTAIPQQNLIVERYDQINWTRFTPKPVIITKPEQPVTSPKAVEKPAEAEQTIQRIDLTDLQNHLNLSALSIAPVPATPAEKRPAQTAASNIPFAKTDLSSLPDNLNLAMDNASPLTAVPPRGRGKSGSGSITLDAASDAESGAGEQTLDQNISADLKGPAGRGQQVKMGTIRLQELAEIEGGLEEFSPNYKALLEWMKRHPADLPPVAKRFMNYQPGDLTSRVAFAIDHRNFDMMLLCVEATYEVRIVLIENRDVTYLIDQGFRKESNFLRVGKVDRLMNQEILKFSTNLKPAGSSQTKEFYQIFISWWESVKHEVE